MRPALSLLQGREYVPSHATNIRKRFEAERKRLKALQTARENNVSHLDEFARRREQESGL